MNSTLSEPFESVAVPLRRDAGGTVRVGPSRVPLDTVIEAWRSGATAEQIAERFDTLSLADVHMTLAFYLLHRTEVDAYLAERARQADDLRREIEAAQPPASALRERLLARQASDSHA